MTTTIAKRQNGNPSNVLGNVVDSIFQNSMRRFFDGNFWDMDNEFTYGNVPVNIRETEQHYELDVIAPGCKKEDFSVHIHDNLLTISFAGKHENTEQKKGWERNEYMVRSFSRCFTLDDTVDINKINAVYTDGILRLTLGKSEKVKQLSRNIEIK